MSKLPIGDFAGVFLFLAFIFWGAVLGMVMAIAGMLAVVGISYLRWGWWLSSSSAVIRSGEEVSFSSSIQPNFFV